MDKAHNCFELKVCTLGKCKESLKLTVWHWDPSPPQTLHRSSLVSLPSIPSHPTGLHSPREQEVDFYSPAFHHTLLVYTSLENKKLIITPQHTITPYWFTLP